MFWQMQCRLQWVLRLVSSVNFIFRFYCRLGKYKSPTFEVLGDIFQLNYLNFYLTGQKRYHRIIMG